MAKCPFLSTQKKKVNCFNDCPFHEYEESDGKCPFRAIETQKMFKVGYLYNDLLKSQSINLLDELYEEKNFTNIFQGV
ncbi:hypothetical protein Z968_08730 [Clostridium novyi A str. 4552]|uniref:Uncharacterized protein n=1 Tax=Clostridium novyi A str. 4552 TaxID=1444289 RepID=A0A0A0I463_CLONO|nr:hypothetical protein [Clostridium novyi]KGM95597.1 hypothetical protein Z968_08730 [Clostridium novyi A str. 4552]